MPIPKRLAALLSAAALSATTLIAAPAASAATGDDAAVVNAWYTDFLGRPAYGDTGAQGWVDRLAFQTPSDVLWSLTHTGEYNAGEIDYYYNAFLGRDSDRGSNYWYQGVNNGAFPLEWVEQNILASAEYARINGGNASSGQIYDWYYRVLGNESIPGEGREITPGEIRYWQNRVRAIGSLGALRELYYTPEAVGARIAGNYYYTLGRFPSDGEIAYWYPKEVESDINVAVLIASTPEYRSQAS